MNSKEFLYKYLNNASPVSYEDSGQKIWLDYLKEYTDDYMLDKYGTAVAIINPDAEKKVVIEAHADEISWMVNYISEDGYLYVIRNGGSDELIAPSMRVNIHGDKGIVEGVFGWPAIHTRIREKDTPKPEIHTIFVDCGCENKEEVEELGIHVGTILTYQEGLTELNDRFYTGRALDNRMGGYMIAEVARKLKENKQKLDYTLYVVNSVQEEVGLHGATMITQTLKPDVAIVTDVCHDTHSPMYNKIKEGDTKAGKGPAITYAPSIHRKVRDLIVETAKEKEIPFQYLASSRSTGTDTDAFAFSNGGVPSALISLPLKYMHTTVETVHKSDVTQVIQLIYETLLKLDPKQDFRYF